MPAKYPKVGMASSQGLSGNGKDVWHFNPSSMRDLGRRYAVALLSLSDNTVIPRKGGNVGIFAKPTEAAMTKILLPQAGEMKVFSLDGKQVSVEKASGNEELSSEAFLIRASKGKTLQILPD